jgi:hopanoid biosynthesis associated protein HpnK
MDRRIIVNADDFGLCEGVNRAVVQAHTSGVLTSTTIMANMPSAEEAVQTAKQLPGLGVGVHLNLTEGPPISKADDVRPLLNADGQFGCSVGKLSFFSLASPKFRKAVKTELAAQVQWVVERGIKPTHLDSHKHIHSFPAIYPIVCGLAKRFGIVAIRWPFEPKEVSAMPWPLLSEGGRERARLVRIMARINRLQNSDFLKNDIFLGVAHTGKIDVSFFRTVALYNSAAVAEIMTHPGFVEGMDNVRTRLVRQRKVELDALCSEKTKQYIGDAGIKLVHYGQI